MTTPILLDIEASGLGRGSYPIEVGYALADGRSNCLLIKPLDDWQRWDIDAEQLHGISRTQLQQRGVDVVTVAETLNRELGGMTVYSDAWGNDQSWLALLFDRAARVQGFRLEALHALLNETQLSLWIDTKQMVESELALGRHRASNDARILQQTYLRTLIGGGVATSSRRLLHF
jgi:RimJ/RimL family protein N-acetyltransferase